MAVVIKVVGKRSDSLDAIKSRLVVVVDSFLRLSSESSSQFRASR